MSANATSANKTEHVPFRPLAELRSEYWMI